MIIRYKILREGAAPPRYMTLGSAGGDLIACPEDGEHIGLAPGCRAIVGCGFAVELPQGLEMQIRPRSGLAMKHGVTVLNSPGTIDSDYRGEVGVLLVNLGQEPYVVSPGDRIAQAVVAFVIEQPLFELAEDLNETERGAGGLGSTGVTSDAADSRATNDAILDVVRASAGRRCSETLIMAVLKQRDPLEVKGVIASMLFTGVLRRTRGSAEMVELPR